MEKSLLCGGGNYVVVVDEVKVNIGPSILPHPLVDEAEYFLVKVTTISLGGGDFYFDVTINRVERYVKW